MVPSTLTRMPYSTSAADGIASPCVDSFIQMTWMWLSACAFAGCAIALGKVPGSMMCCHADGRFLLSRVDGGVVNADAWATCQSACVRCRLAVDGCAASSSEYQIPTAINNATEKTNTA